MELRAIKNVSKINNIKNRLFYSDEDQIYKSVNGTGFTRPLILLNKMAIVVASLKTLVEMALHRGIKIEGGCRGGPYERESQRDLL